MKGYALPQRAFDELVARGACSGEFEHAPPAQAFFRECVGRVARGLDASRGLSVLDCGCGTGVWLDFLARTLFASPPAPVRYYGFDVSAGMIGIARRKLAGRVPSDHLRQGDILEDAAYAFGDLHQAFDLIYAYDVVQQLPRRRQLDASRAMLRHLVPGGAVVVFDHERNSAYGRWMGLKKLLTRRLRLGLVPQFYCNARYPALAAIGRRLEVPGALIAEITRARDFDKRALILRSLGVR